MLCRSLSRHSTLKSLYRCSTWRLCGGLPGSTILETPRSSFSDGGVQLYIRHSLTLNRDHSARDALLLLAPKLTVLDESDGTYLGPGEYKRAYDEEGNVYFWPLDEYSEGRSMRGFLDFLLAAKKLKHLRSSCQSVFHTPCLLGVFARLHSLSWEPDIAHDALLEHVEALSKLRASLWKLAQAVGRPDYLLEASDVQLLSEATGEHEHLASDLEPLAEWLAEPEWAELTAQGWNEQEERGPNEHHVFYPPYFTTDVPFSRHSGIMTAYEHPRVEFRL